MFEWWGALSTLLKALYCITIPSTLILIIQTVMVLLGFDDGGTDADIDISDIPDDISDVDNDFDVSDFAAMRFFTLQTTIAFLTVFGWSSIVSLQSGCNTFLSMIIGAVLGLFSMFLVAKLVQLSSKLQENGTQNLRYALGKNATVYISIPKNNTGNGKVTFTLQSTFTEHEAITFGDEDLKVGTEVRIVDIVGDKLVVEKE